LEVSAHAIGYPPLYRGEWEHRLNDIGGAKPLQNVGIRFLELRSEKQVYFLIPAFYPSERFI
jgi:hypothetical protein